MLLQRCGWFAESRGFHLYAELLVTGPLPFLENTSPGVRVVPTLNPHLPCRCRLNWSTGSFFFDGVCVSCVSVHKPRRRRREG